MPQSMLALLALAIFTQLTFSQQQVTVKSYERQIRDELSVAASGMMMEVMELMAARPFDAKSSPGHVLANGLPTLENGEVEDDDFSSIGPGASETGCTPLNIDIGACSDLDDLDLDGYPNDSSQSDEAWFPIELELSNGGVLPFEIKIDVTYVDGEFPDVDVEGEKTTSKRVDLLVRSPLLFESRPFIHLERVVAYDPNKAAADCVRAAGENHPDAINCSTPSDDI